MVTVTKYNVQDSWASIFLEEDGRVSVCTIGRELPELWRNLNVAADRGDYEDGLKQVQDYIAKSGISVAAKPRIEDASKAMQAVYGIFEDDDLDDDTHFVEEQDVDPDFYAELGMTQVEFERQIAADIRKYNLGDVLVFGDGGGWTGYCLEVFPALRDAFSKPVSVD